MRMLLVLLLVLPVLGGCEKMKNSPVSVANTPLIGDWYGERQLQDHEVTATDRLLVQVQADGYVSYHFLSCESGGVSPEREKRLDLKQMPITRLNTVKMVLQSYPLTPKFELTLGAWPDQDNGIWQVDEIPLKKVDSSQLPQPAEWACAATTLQ